MSCRFLFVADSPLKLLRTIRLQHKQANEKSKICDAAESLSQSAGSRDVFKTGAVERLRGFADDLWAGNMSSYPCGLLSQ